MFYRVYVHVVDMTLIIGIIADQMLPVVALLNATFTRCFSNV